MNQPSEKKPHYFLPLKVIVVLVVIVSVVVFTTSAFKNNNSAMDTADYKNADTDSTESVQAFLQVYKVLMSPRCMNCHPAGDEPLQGDDSKIHTMKVQRGKDGKGVYAAKCSNCHQPENTPGLHTPPGNPKWSLPPADMKMVFQGRTSHQLALQIMDYNKNGHKNKKQLLEHARDTLVKAAWNMGEGRKPPPLSYDAFVKAWDTWIQKGGYAPK
jgi:mono/diheme cytochrome c family protein